MKKCNQPIQKYKSRHIILSNTKRINITTKTSKQQQSLSSSGRNSAIECFTIVVEHSAVCHFRWCSLQTKVRHCTYGHWNVWWHDSHWCHWLLWINERSEATRQLLHHHAFNLRNWTLWDWADAWTRPKIHRNRAELSSADYKLKLNSVTLRRAAMSRHLWQPTVTQSLRLAATWQSGFGHSCVCCTAERRRPPRKN